MIGVEVCVCVVVSELIIIDERLVKILNPMNDIHADVIMSSKK